MPAVPDSPASDIGALRAVVDEAIARGDIDAALSALRAGARQVVFTDGAAFRELVGAIPDGAWHSDAAICAAMGASYRSAGSPRGPASIGYFRAAEIALEASDTGRRTNRRVAVLTGYASALRLQGRLGEALEKIEAATTLLETVPEAPDYMERSARLALETAMLQLDLGRFDDASEHFDYAYGLGAAHLTVAEQVECLGGMAVIAYTQGELGRVDAYVEEADALGATESVMRGGFGAPAISARLLTMIDRHSFDQTRELIALFDEAAVGTEWEPFALIVQAFSKALSRSPIEALDLLHRARQEYRTWRPAAFGRDVGELLRAEVMASLGDGAEAFAILSTLDPGERHSLCPARYIAQQRLGHGDLVGAAQALDDCAALGEMHSPRTKMGVQLLRGAIEFERGNLTMADVDVDRALLTMARTGVRSPLRHVPAALLAQIAARALTRTQNPEVTRILHGVVASTEGLKHDTEVLSERERLVLTYVERELTVSAIAAELYISPNTVKTHLRRLYRKLGVSTREEAIRTARSLGLHFEPRDVITRESPGRQDDPPDDAVV